MCRQRSSTLSIRWVENKMVVPSIEFQYFVFDQLRIDRVEPAEGLVEMSSCGSCSTVVMNWIFCAMPLDSLYLFPHQSCISKYQTNTSVQASLRSVQTFQSREVGGLFANSHFLVESAFFWQIANVVYVFFFRGAPLSRI